MELDHFMFELLGLMDRRSINNKFIGLNKTKVKNIYMAYVADLKEFGQIPDSSNDSLEKDDFKIVARIKNRTGYTPLEVELVLVNLANGFKEGIFNLSLINPIEAKQMKKNTGGLLSTIPFVGADTTKAIAKTTKTVTIIAALAATGYFLNQVTKLKFW